MCGIAGIFSFDRKRNFPPTLIKQMTNTLVHRGPDAEGHWQAEGIALGHRRLSIIAPTGGEQPMHSHSGEQVITYNGEFYNYQRVLKNRPELAPKTHSDTEVLLELLEQDGTRGIESINGMFAIGLYKKKKHSLTLIRDRAGIKPLFYTINDGVLYFGSELKAIIAALDATPEIDQNALGEYFRFGHIPSPKTIYQGIYKLPPAHYLCADAQGIIIHRYWSPQSEKYQEHRSEEFLQLLNDAVRLRMISDVPLGAFLSGGIDSSTLVALMKRHNTICQTFSIGFPVDTYDETSYARMVAAQLGTTHKERIVAESGLSQLQNLVHYLDEPMSDPAILPTWQVSALARESVTVALSGDGADELFGGYERYRFALIANLVKRFTNQGFNKGMSQFMQLATSVTGGKFHTDQFRKFFQFTSRNDDPYFGLIEYFSPEEIQQNFHLELSSSAAWQTITTQNTNQADYLSLILTEDFHHYLADDILVKTDRMSMAVSLEARVPYLDHRLIEFAFSLPIKEKISARGHLKKFLRKSVAPLLPSRILTRPKMGFALPLKEWFADVNNQRIDDLLLAKNSTLSNYMEQCTLKKLLMEHRKEGKNRAFQLYNLFLFETWAQGERKK